MSYKIAHSLQSRWASLQPVRWLSCWCLALVWREHKTCLVAIYFFSWFRNERKYRNIRVCAFSCSFMACKEHLTKMQLYSVCACVCVCAYVHTSAFSNFWIHQPVSAGFNREFVYPGHYVPTCFPGIRIQIEETKC